MNRNMVLELPLAQLMVPRIALSLQSVQVHTVGAFLRMWQSPELQRQVEQMFDSPLQARHAMTTFACWLGLRPAASSQPIVAWWVGDVPRSEVSASDAVM